MLPTIKSEFRKLFTIRSTYILTFLALALVVLFAFYFEGYKGNTGSPASELAPTALAEITSNAIGLTVIFLSFIAALFMAHEYRYNTIMYTLTANAHRTRVLLAKAFTILVFSAGYALLTILVALVSYKLGLSLRDASLPSQEFVFAKELGKILFYSGAYALLGLVIAVLTRSVIGAIAVIMIVPTTVEPLLGNFFKDDAKYLPFASIDGVLNVAAVPNALSTGTAMLVGGSYLVASLIIAWILFVRRDAN